MNISKNAQHTKLLHHHYPYTATHHTEYICFIKCENFVQFQLFPPAYKIAHVNIYSQIRYVGTTIYNATICTLCTAVQPILQLPSAIYAMCISTCSNNLRNTYKYRIYIAYADFRSAIFCKREQNCELCFHFALTVNFNKSN